MDDYNSAETFNRMFRDSEKRGYNTSYTKVNNQSYGKKNDKSSNAKVLTTIFVGGVILYYTYKNVLKPAAKVIKKIIGLFDDEDEKPVNAKRHASQNDRVFDGRVKALSPKEASKLIKGSSIAFEDSMNPGSYYVK